MNRTHNNGELRISNISEIVELKGWVSKSRNLGGLIFLDLRDRKGITQVVIDPDNSNYEEASLARSEYVVYVKGEVIERISKNKNIPTGDIEIKAVDFHIINEAKTTPFTINENTEVLEETTLKYRYLDIRRPEKQKYLIERSKIAAAVRNFLADDDFIEIETPMLGKSTPEGARDYLVPSRLYAGQFYALPQSPQIYKQLLMIGGIEKYYQIAKCFRDEDLRADRQPEFTQIDIETSFMSQDEIIDMTERMLKKTFKKVLNKEIVTPFIKMTHNDAMNVYGSDKPDTRFDMKLIDLTEITRKCGFGVFENAETVKCINAKNLADKYSRKKIDELTEYLRKFKAKGLAWLKVTSEGLTGPIAKFFDDETIAKIENLTASQEGDILLFVADKKSVCNTALGELRLKVARDNEVINKSLYNFLWVIDWPLFEHDEEDGRLYAAHHPFTAPKKEDEGMLVTAPKTCLADAYDIVLNGYELGGGSIRIYNQEMQANMFRALGFTDEEATKQFGFLMEALKYGTPPHGGIALGLDRMVMLMTGTENIKDVVAFPKTQSARDAMMEAPNTVSEDQLKELNIKIRES